MIYIDGVYHLFFQYNPSGDQWGNISWGHATSKDLIHWEEQAVAIPCEPGEMIFSGTAVLDRKNSFGKGKNSLIAIYTSFFYEEKEGEIRPLSQSQSLAYSHDQGSHFVKYEGNPVLDIGSKEFRDPKVFWHEESNSWIMLLSLADKHKIAFYRSPDLVNWTKTSEFGPYGNVEAVWECPDLFELEIENDVGSKWVLSLSAGGANEGQLGMQYFIGEFDGHSFQAIPSENPTYLDWGNDFYAGITFANLPESKPPLMLAWVNSHHYAKEVPTYPWRGAMSLPRQLNLRRRSKDQWVLIQTVPDHFQSLGKEISLPYPSRLKKEGFEFKLHSNSFKLEASIQMMNSSLLRLSLNSDRNEKCVFIFDAQKNEVSFDRSASSMILPSPYFSEIVRMPLDLRKNKLSFELWLDHSILELIADQGEKSLTSQVFMQGGFQSITIFNEGGEVLLDQFSLWEI